MPQPWNRTPCVFPPRAICYKTAVATASTITLPRAFRRWGALIVQSITAGFVASAVMANPAVAGGNNQCTVTIHDPTGVNLTPSSDLLIIQV
jgi:hypothetical protein